MGSRVTDAGVEQLRKKLPKAKIDIRYPIHLTPLSKLDDAVGNHKLVGDYGYWFWNWQ